MDDDDFRALIAVVAGELRASGAADIADGRHYSKLDEETGEARLLEPQLRLVEMLKAFDRFLAIQDRNTYNAAILSISQSVESESPRRATVTLTTDGAPHEVDLSTAPDLKPIREDLQRLIRRILDGDLRPDGELG